MGGGVLRVLGVLVLAVVIAMQVSPAALASDSSASGPGPASDPRLAPASFSMNVRVNTGGLGFDHQVEPTMVVDSQGRIFVGWKEAFTHNGGGQRVAFAYSSDGGDTFSPNVLMPLATLDHQSDPWLTVTGDDRVFFTRIEYDSTSTAGGLAVTNTTDGASWGTTYYYDDAPNFADKESAAHDAAGNLYWVWNTDSPARQDLAFARSDDGGATWNPEVLVSGPGTLGGIVQVHPNGTVLATWWSYMSNNIFFDRSFDGGATWGSDIRVNGAPGSAVDSGAWQIPIPAMNVDPDSGRIYIAWPDARNGNLDIYGAVSDDGGATWTDTRIDDDPGTALQYMVDLAVDPAGTVHAAWEDRRTGNWSIRYANSTDGGLTWNPSIPVSDRETPAAYNRPGDYFALESGPDGTIYAVWTDGRGSDLDIYFAKLVRNVAYTIDTVPAGLTVSVDSVQVTAPATFSWPVGSDHTISAPSPQAAGPLSRRVFDMWSDGGGASHAVRVGNESATITATFHTEHQVTVRSQPIPLEVLVDATTVLGTTTRWWAEGSTHDLASVGPQAVAYGTRYSFSRWADGAPDPRTVTVSGPGTYEALYRLEFLLTVASAHGTPTGGGWYAANDLATIGVEASVPGGPGTRYEFTGWTGDVAAATPAATAIMNGPKNATASWRTEHRLTVQSDFGTPQGAGWYPEGSVVAVTVEETVLVDGRTYRFTGWAGDVTDPSSDVLVTMDGPKALTATWEDVTTPGDGGPSGVNPLPWAVVALALAVITALVLFVWWRRRRKDEKPPT